MLVALAAAASPSARGVAPAARNDDVSKPDPAGDVKAKGLTSGERRAIDIVRVEATGDTFGATVTVTFAGSFEAAVGRGKLSDAIAGIVLRRGSGRPIVVATHGPGVRGNDGGGGGGGPFVVVRQGRSVTFIARNVDFTKIRRLEARTYTALVQPRRTTQQIEPIIEFYRLIAIRPGEDFWEAENRADDEEDHCQNLRDQLAKEEGRRRELIREVNRARAQGRRATAARLGEDLQKIGEFVRELELKIDACNTPPAVDFGCQEASVPKHPQAANHHVVALGLCKKTIDRVDVVFAAPFQRIDPQAVVVQISARTFRLVPVTASSDRALTINIQPPMQTTEGLNAAVQGIPSGTRVTITPFEAGAAGQAYDVAAA